MMAWSNKLSTMTDISTSMLSEASTTCGSEWVDGAAERPDSKVNPPATAGGTDFNQPGGTDFDQQS
jgi:hypothetical protein